MLALEIPEAVAIRTAFGTSLLVILPTAISGALRHEKNGAIRWKVALTLGSSGFPGALLGAILAARASGEMLELGFGGLILAVALWMGLRKTLQTADNARTLQYNSALLAVSGFPIGMVTGLTGIGGGVLIVPVLILAFNFPVHVAVGTSVATIIFTSLGGVVGYILSGFGMDNLLPYSLGYINLPLWLCLAATSVPLAQLGATVAHLLPAKPLRYIFVAFLVYAGLRMIGIF